MKNTYTTPKLSSFGNVVEMTQVIGNPTGQDFVYLNGNIISGSNDIDSTSLYCTGSLPNINCSTNP